MRGLKLAQCDVILQVCICLGGHSLQSGRIGHLPREQLM